MHSGLALLMDVQRAGRFVRHHARHFGIEAGRVGACEGSSGGHLASLLGTLASTGDPHDPDPVKRESARVQCVMARAQPAPVPVCVQSSRTENRCRRQR